MHSTHNIQNQPLTLTGPGNQNVSREAALAITQYCVNEVGATDSVIESVWYEGKINLFNLMDYAARNEGFDSADEYHEWYIKGGDIPDHGDSVWPVFLHQTEVLLDGWHRLHSYYQKGMAEIPYFSDKNMSEFVELINRGDELEPAGQTISP